MPVVLLPSEINLLVPSLRDRERTLVLLAAGTGLRMSELFGLKWGDVDFAGKQVMQNRSIPKAGSSRSRKQAVRRQARRVRTLRSIVKQAVGPSSTDRLGFRQSGSPGEVSILGAGPLATLHPSGCGEGGHHQTNRLAYLSAFVFNVAEGKWSGHKGHAGTASACVHTRDTRHVHAGCNPGETSGSNRGRQTVLSEFKSRLGNRRPN